MKKLFLLSVALFAFMSCVKNDNEGAIKQEERKDFSLSDKISVNVSFADNARCLLFTSYPYNEDGNLICEPVMAANAPFNEQIIIPKSVETLYMYVNGKVMEFPRGDINLTRSNAASRAPLSRVDVVELPGSYSYVSFDNDFISAIYAFYPEGENNVVGEDLKISTDLVAPKGVKRTYLDDQGATVTESYGNTQLWLTYVGDGASGFSGNLWYYTYNVDGNKTPTNSLADIEGRLIKVFNKAHPNNQTESAGDMVGKRVYLGEFEPGTRIGFKYLGNATLEGQPYPKFSTPFYNNSAYGNLNSLNNATCGVIRTWDYQNVKYATLGMENRLPSESQWDDDFNDMICLVESNQLMVENKIIPPPDPEFKKWSGYWLFEDNYPYEGDYDFNDLVVKYTITETVGQANAKIDLQFMARGASYNNSFGINNTMLFSDLSGFINVFSNYPSEAQPIETIYMLKAEVYIPMLNNGVTTFDLYSYNGYSNDFPCVLDISVVDNFKFIWCLEYTRIDEAYPRYKSWVDSKCTENTDWYKDTPILGTTWNK